MTDNEPHGWRDSELPPRPDSETGEPFPPHGLSFFESRAQGAPEHDPNRETRLSRKPEPPTGYGPVLAWRMPSIRVRIMSIAFSAAVLIAGLMFAQIIMGNNPLEIFEFWQMWVIIIGGALLMAAPMTVTTYAAGADWLMMRRTRWGRTTRVWVDLYELTKIRAHFIGGGYHLDLDDKDISLAVTFPAVQADRRIWDLIYNGILHSVANGATIDNVSIGVLNIQHTPALDIRNTNNPDQTEPDGS